MNSDSTSLHHPRRRDDYNLVYPVRSRRSGGLSIGVDPFPDAKCCNFDCPYCEVAPFSGGLRFDIGLLAEELERFLTATYPERWSGEAIRDICISGNGEPTLSPHFDAIAEACDRARNDHADIASTARLVVITNSTGFLSEAGRESLATFGRLRLSSIWAKLDSVRPLWFSRLSGSAYDAQAIQESIAAFSRTTAVTIQTMLCSLDGSSQSTSDIEDYASRLARMAGEGSKFEAVHPYTVARIPVYAGAEALDEATLSEAVAVVKAALGPDIPVTGYGEYGIIDSP